MYLLCKAVVFQWTVRPLWRRKVHEVWQFRRKVLAALRWAVFHLFLSVRISLLLLLLHSLVLQFLLQVCTGSESDHRDVGSTVQEQVVHIKLRTIVNVQCGRTGDAAKGIESHTLEQA